MILREMSLNNVYKKQFFPRLYSILPSRRRITLVTVAVDKKLPHWM